MVTRVEGGGLLLLVEEESESESEEEEEELLDVLDLRRPWTARGLTTSASSAG